MSGIGGRIEVEEERSGEVEGEVWIGEWEEWKREKIVSLSKFWILGRAGRADEGGGGGGRGTSWGNEARPGTDRGRFGGFENRDHAKKFWGALEPDTWKKKNWGEGKVFLGTGCIFERGLSMHATPRWRGTLDISAKSKNDCEGKTGGKYLYLYLPYLPYTFPSPSSCWTHLEIGDNLAGWIATRKMLAGQGNSTKMEPNEKKKSLGRGNLGERFNHSEALKTKEDRRNLTKWTATIIDFASQAAQGRHFYIQLHAPHSLLDHHLSRPFPDDGSMQPQRQNVRRKSQGPPFLHTPRFQHAERERAEDRLLAAGWSLGNVAGAVRSGTAHHPRRFVAYTGCGLPMLPDDSPFSWVGVAYPYLTLPWEIGGGLFLFLFLSLPLAQNEPREGKKENKKSRCLSTGSQRETETPRDDYVISDVSHLVRLIPPNSEPGIGAVISHGAGIGTWDDDQAQRWTAWSDGTSTPTPMLRLAQHDLPGPVIFENQISKLRQGAISHGRSQNSGYYSRIRTQYTHSGISKMKARNARTENRRSMGAEMPVWARESFECFFFFFFFISVAVAGLFRPWFLRGASHLRLSPPCSVWHLQSGILLLLLFPLCGLVPVHTWIWMDAQHRFEIIPRFPWLTATTLRSHAAMEGIRARRRGCFTFQCLYLTYQRRVQIDYNPRSHPGGQVGECHWARLKVRSNQSTIRESERELWAPPDKRAEPTWSQLGLQIETQPPFDIDTDIAVTGGRTPPVSLDVFPLRSSVRLSDDGIWILSLCACSVCASCTKIGRREGKAPKKTTSPSADGAGTGTWSIRSPAQGSNFLWGTERESMSMSI
ncbi:hypothetical protein CCUS01_17181 [Colletotrichum cuscutae]|uniref:Uncharacterized protein n=1 Tax=Colletotrichum cuscutae TaxID=1209917 RepID=A0AAI9V906_9PEZI|nr:hypothetical protein CCUS01_17181 [Colletotrichum cuscutae]